ncbi:cupin domain-containing protein [Francisella sp. SYW-9]|uniref:cupin domain-containing protein n=1 Tax=Francisella sp. SYW-9 TaxID=2610888 RepID=UPI00123E091D|nr:cupin domain-containing protein [Francisella sp. SYW-9]
MAKSTVKYWNTLALENSDKWQTIENTNNKLEELTLSIDTEFGDYTRLTRFKPGADTTSFGAKSHEYPEEVFIVSGRLYDISVGRWLEAGEYASRPPGEIHGPFKTDVECIVLEVSYLSKIKKN